MVKNRSRAKFRSSESSGCARKFDFFVRIGAKLRFGKYCFIMAIVLISRLGGTLSTRFESSADLEFSGSFFSAMRMIFRRRESPNGALLKSAACVARFVLQFCRLAMSIAKKTLEVVARIVQVADERRNNAELEPH